MRGLQAGLALLVVMGTLAGSVSAGRAAEPFVNGYTYLAPSMYLTPPIVYYDPAMVIPAPYVVRPMNAPAPVPQVVYGGPAYVVPAAPVYAPPSPGGYAVPSVVRERGRYSRNGLEYKYRQYVPGRAAPVYTYRIDSEPNGVRIRERYR